LVKYIEVLITSTAVGIGGSSRIIQRLPCITRWHTYISLHEEDQWEPQAQLHTSTEVGFHDHSIPCPEVLEATVHQIVELLSWWHTQDGRACYTPFGAVWGIIGRGDMTGEGEGGDVRRHY